MWFGPNSIKLLNKGQETLATPESDLAAVISEVAIPDRAPSQAQLDQTSATLAAIAEENKEREQAVSSNPNAMRITPDAIVPRSIDKFFSEKFDAITRVLPYKEQWANSTGYFNGIVKGDHAIHCLNTPIEHERLVQPGEAVKAVDPTGRRLIIIGTNLGPVVVFERYKAPYAGNPQLYVTNAPIILNHSGLVPSSSLSEDDLRRILGDSNGDNLGLTLSDLSTSIVHYLTQSRAFQASLQAAAQPTPAAPVEFGKI